MNQGAYRRKKRFVVSGITVKLLVPRVVITLPPKGYQFTGGMRFVADSTCNGHDEVGQKRFNWLFPPFRPTIRVGALATAKAVSVLLF